eukprot:2772212-Alexandrium_andersonii.AAC.1
MLMRGGCSLWPSWRTPKIPRPSSRWASSMWWSTGRCGPRERESSLPGWLQGVNKEGWKALEA